MAERRIDGMRVAEFGFPRTPLRRRLVDLILTGEKKAGAALLVDFESEDDELPTVGEQFVLLDFDDEPVGVIETTEIRIVRAADVDEQFARDEGEGFESVADWRAAHDRFFGLSEETYREFTGDPNWSFGDDSMVVCERFKLVRTL
ncbi:MAG: ASCH domain-containing protein [Actinomycetota bacterium]|nr:ASCH domain-containing protein [Actinomycetota bacterium]